MTKTKKVAAAAVAVVLAGTVAVGFTACGKNKETNSYGDGVVNMALADGATLNVAIGYNNDDTGLFYGATVGSTKTFVGNYQAFSNGAKPATQAIMDATGITLKNKYGGKSTSANLTELVSNNSWGDSVDMATSDLSVASTYAANGSVLNLADYLDYMPNFKAFLEANPIVYLSVLGYDSDADRYGTTAGENAPLYVAPYFDGMDDIEKGCLMRQDWIKAVLDDTWYTGETGDGGASDDTFYDVCYADMSSSEASSDHRTAGTRTYAESYMGKTGSWSITSTSEGDSTGATTVTITKNYEEAKTAVEKTGEGLNSAYCEIAGSNATYSGDSGNIVDIMNAAISTDLENHDSDGGYNATGKNLANLYKEYIKVAYTVDGEQYYNEKENPISNVFCGYSACWDVDDLTALLRIIKCSSGQVGLEKDQKTTGIFARDYTNDRLPDLISLVGELYGARGATSRYEAVYIDKDGNIHDAPQEEKFWDSLERFGGLAKEGLVDGGYAYNGGYNSASGTYLDDMHGTTSKEGVGFMQWDYSQTQTTLEFDKNANSDLLQYGWVNTPVSIWDDGTTSDSDYSYASSSSTSSTGALTEGKYMRFTDSWRSTKTAGLVVSSSVTKSEKRLAAALKFVDFLYSNDGQITTTYAIQDTSKGHDNASASDKTTGTWYGDEISASSVASGASFEDICDETYQYVIKSEYNKNYVVYDGQICDKDGNPQVDEDGKPLDIEEYAERVSSYTVKENYQDKCFAFDGKLYSGTLYKGKMTPTITKELFAHFTAVSGDVTNYVEADVYPSVRGSFTNFARYILGSTLPICVKDQSFENQMTAEYAKDQATKVSVSIANGTINHCELAITENMFYTCVPTDFPFTSMETNDMNDSTQSTLRFQTGTAYGEKTFWSLYHWVIWFGYEGTYNQNGVTVPFANISGANDLIAYLEGNPTGNTKGLLATRIGNIQAAWDRALTYWEYISGTNS